ncbi:putative disease resistance protein RGA3 [Panicum virgatum]|nr:putative disease resistance protein RGA3 [Panicum virgatum]
MNILLTAVLNELTTRSINFLIKNSFKPTAPDMEDRLRRILLRAQVIIDEAIGRQITNRGVLEQLDKLRDSMHHGYYILDTFIYQSQSEKETKGQVLSNTLSLSNVVNSLQGLCSSSRNTQISEQLQKSLDDLSSMIIDMEEIIVFLMSYPRLYRQPYSMHLLVGNCMFGRHMEMELVISFLLHTQPHAPKELEVLPIVGPGKVGKSTLVAHVCEDARVRNHFSEILFLHGHDLTGVDLAALKEGYVMEHQNPGSNSNKEGRRLLIVVDLVGTLTEDVWNRLYSASIQHAPSGSKIIITSRSDEIIKFGTTRTLSLKYLSHEAYWYFFKMLTFGSMDPEMHPRLARMAMEIARMMNGCFISANVVGCLLRDNIDFHFWYKVLAFLSGMIKKHISKFGVHPFDLLNGKKPTHLGRMFIPSEDFVLHYDYQRSSQDDVPKIRIQDVIYGSVKAEGTFEALGWRSRIPPYHSYVAVCEIRGLKTAGAKRKRPMKNGVTLY